MGFLASLLEQLNPFILLSTNRQAKKREMGANTGVFKLGSRVPTSLLRRARVFRDDGIALGYKRGSIQRRFNQKE